MFYAREYFKARAWIVELEARHDKTLQNLKELKDLVEETKKEIRVLELEINKYRGK